MAIVTGFEQILHIRCTHHVLLKSASHVGQVRFSTELYLLAVSLQTSAPDTYTAGRMYAIQLKQQ